MPLEGYIVLAILVVSAINWLVKALTGKDIFESDWFEDMFDNAEMIAKAIYIIVGIVSVISIYMILTAKGDMGVWAQVISGILVIGGLNHGIKGVIGKDLFEILGDDESIIAKGVYVIVGLCGLYGLWVLFEPILNMVI